MPRLRGPAAVLTAAETARQWARSNPDQAEAYIDKAVGFIDRRTGGKYHSKVTGLSGHAKKALLGMINEHFAEARERRRELAERPSRSEAE